jgi:chromosome segregation ATPase
VNSQVSELEKVRLKLTEAMNTIESMKNQNQEEESRLITEYQNLKSALSASELSIEELKSQKADLAKVVNSQVSELEKVRLELTEAMQTIESMKNQNQAILTR